MLRRRLQQLLRLLASLRHNPRSSSWQQADDERPGNAGPKGCEAFSYFSSSQQTNIQGRRQVKQSGVDSMGRVWGGVSPPKSGARVWGYNLKLISTLHNDSIPETPSRKRWGGQVHPSPPRGNVPANIA